MKKNKLSIVILALAAAMTACKKDNNSSATTPVTAKTTSNLNADPASTGNHYAFYSLERGEAVAYTDSATTKWDIAFRSTTIIINGGTSGPGPGGAFVQTGTTFDEYAKIPNDSTFRVDNLSATPATYAIITGSGNGWYNYNTSTNV
ncbi:MAG: HmuY family protein, partial [Bacteroidetes bacterium]|nr:HmuY family protein [Bacteroidota bacterium]